jgi:hypothetical protein
MTEQRTLDEDDAIVGPAPWAAAAEDTPRPEKPRRRAAVPAAEPEAPVRRRSLSGRLLTVLIVLLIGLGAGLFGGPRLAPMLPAPVAALLAPAQQGVDAGALDALRETLADRIAALESALGEARRETRAAAEAAQQAQAQAAAAREAAAGGDAGIDGLRARLDSMQAEIDALVDAVAAGGGGDGTLPDSVLRELQAEIDTLAAAVAEADGGGESGTVAALRERVVALEAQLERDIAARERMLDAAGDAQRAVAVTTALAEIDRAMALGRPFGPALDNLAEAAGITPPAVLETAAQEGVATREALLNGFNPAAYDAVSEGLAAKESEGVGGVLARVQARFTGIPTDPIPGPSTPAILSRARHALLAGDIDAALTELAELPEPAQAAMAEWIDHARLRHEADTALHDLRVDLGERY